MPPKLTLTTINLGAPDAPALAHFYQRLLGYEIVEEEPNWVLLRPTGAGLPLSVQHEPHYTAPVWPGVADRQGMMAHLEIGVDDLAGSIAHAIECGATEAAFQPQDDVRVMLDPAGHPFCLWLDEG